MLEEARLWKKLLVKFWKGHWQVADPVCLSPQEGQQWPSSATCAKLGLGCHLAPPIPHTLFSPLMSALQHCLFGFLPMSLSCHQAFQGSVSTSEHSQCPIVALASSAFRKGWQRPADAKSPFWGYKGCTVRPPIRYPTACPLGLYGSQLPTRSKASSTSTVVSEPQLFHAHTGSSGGPQLHHWSQVSFALSLIFSHGTLSSAVTTTPLPTSCSPNSAVPAPGTR